MPPIEGKACNTTAFISYQCAIALLLMYSFEVDLLCSKRNRGLSAIPQIHALTKQR